MDKSLVMDGKKKGLLAIHISRESMFYPSLSLWGELLINNNNAAKQHEMPNMQQRTLL